MKQLIIVAEAEESEPFGDLIAAAITAQAGMAGMVSITLDNNYTEDDNGNDD